MKKFVFIKSNKKLVKLFYDDIAVIKGLGNYVEIYTVNDTKYIYYKVMKELIDCLPDEFMRIHNSYIVNLINIDHFEDGHVILNKHKITVSKSYRECFAAAISKLML